MFLFLIGVLLKALKGGRENTGTGKNQNRLVWIKEHSFRWKAAETAEENEMRKKQKRESEETTGFVISSEGSRVAIVTKRVRGNVKGNRARNIAASGKHYEKVRLDGGVTQHSKHGGEIKLEKVKFIKKCIKIRQE